MKDVEIQALIEAMLQTAYVIDDAVAELGDIEEDSVPNTIRLTPKNEDFSQVILEYLELENAPPDERFLSGITIRFANPVEMSFALFEDKYGEPSEGPRLHRNQPIPFRFHLDGYPHSGDLLLYVHQTGDPPTRQAVMMKVLRHPV
jgi:hypothetical protein